MAVKWLDMGIAPLDVVICLSEKDFSALKKKIKYQDDDRFVMDGADANVHNWIDSGGRRISVLCVCPKSARKMDRSQVAALVAHEAVHVMQRIKSIIRDDTTCVEYEAYAVQRVVQETLNLLGYRKLK